MCSMRVDGLNAVTPHVQQRASFAAIAKAPIAKLRPWAQRRGWDKIRVFSSYDDDDHGIDMMSPVKARYRRRQQRRNFENRRAYGRSNATRNRRRKLAFHANYSDGERQALQLAACMRLSH
jgi:predicted dithiol-disulfide oxidoreductase (DUF899 family)